MLFPRFCLCKKIKLLFVTKFSLLAQCEAHLFPENQVWKINCPLWANFGQNFFWSVQKFHFFLNSDHFQEKFRKWQLKCLKSAKKELLYSYPLCWILLQLKLIKVNPLFFRNGGSTSLQRPRNCYLCMSNQK